MQRIGRERTLEKKLSFCQGRVLGREKGATDFTVRRDCGNHYSLPWCLYSNTVRCTTPACIFDVALPWFSKLNSKCLHFFGESKVHAIYV